MVDVVVVGAGLSGLIAARELGDRGAAVLLVDKARAPGGRMATRRLDGSAGRVVADHGAQFFTVRSDRFAREVRGWPAHVWHHGPATARSVEDAPATAADPGDGHERWCGDAGMNGIARHLARDLDVRRGVRVHAVEEAGGRWQLQTDTSTISAPRLLLTPPAPQAVALLPDGLAGPDLTDLAYEPCLALLVDADADPPRPAVQFDEGPIRYLADNRSKGIAADPTITVHAHGDWSAARYDDDEDAVATALWDLAAPWLAPAAARGWQLKRWRYANPVDVHDERAVEVARGLVLAGDAFGGAKVEGAVLSGLAAADVLSP